MEAQERTLANETLEVLKAIHTEQQKQGKHLRNIYQILLILFVAILISFTVGLMAAMR